MWSVEAPYQLVQQVVRRHSGGRLTPHALRHAFAVAWLSQGWIPETGLMAHRRVVKHRHAGDLHDGRTLTFSRRMSIVG